MTPYYLSRLKKTFPDLDSFLVLDKFIRTKTEQKLSLILGDIRDKKMKRDIQDQYLGIFNDYLKAFNTTEIPPKINHTYKPKLQKYIKKHRKNLKGTTIK